MRISLSIVGFLLCGFTIGDTVSQEQEMDIEAAMQKAHYHLDEFKNSMADVTSFHRQTSRTKRDVDVEQKMKRHRFLFNSLLDFCFRLQDFDKQAANSSSSGEKDNMTTTTTSTPSIDTSTSTTSTTMNTNTTISTSTITPTMNITDDEDEDDPWNVPDIHPLLVDAVAEEDKIHLLFLANHSSPIHVTRLAGFDVEMTSMDKAHNARDTIQSLARFVVPTAAYCELGYEMDNIFTFENPRKSGNSVILRLDVCLYSKYRNRTDGWEDSPLDFVSEEVQLPRFRVNNTSNSKRIDVVTVTPGMNDSFNVTVLMDSRTSVRISGIFHDRSTRKMLADEYRLDLAENNTAVVQNEIRKRKGMNPIQLFTVEVLDNSPVNNASGLEKKAEEAEAKHNQQEIPLRVTTITESGQLSGKIYLEAVRQYGAKYNYTLIKSVSVNYVIRIRKPKNPRVFPRRRVYMDGQSIFLCNKNGNINSEKVGRNCTLSCSATGRSMLVVQISKDDGVDVPLYQSRSQKTNNRISLLVDLGQASPAINGSYTCTVTDAIGNRHTRQLFLYSSPPQIDTNKISFTEFGNDTSIVLCTAKGYLPMKIDVEIHSAFGQVMSANETNSTWYKTEGTDGTVALTVAIPSVNLRPPAHSVVCLVSNDLGSDNDTIPLPNTSPTETSTETDKNMTAKMKPKIIPKESGIVSFDNGTSTITCVARHASSLNVVVPSVNNSAGVQLETIPGLHSVQMVKDEKRSVKWFSEIGNFIQTNPWFLCVASNDYGADYFTLSRKWAF